MITIGDKVKIQERCNEGKQNKNVIFEVVAHPYPHARYHDDYVTIKGINSEMQFKAFSVEFLTLIK